VFNLSFAVRCHTRTYYKLLMNTANIKQIQNIQYINPHAIVTTLTFVLLT